MADSDDLEERVDRLEREIADLKTQLNDADSQSKSWSNASAEGPPSAKNTGTDSSDDTPETPEGSASEPTVDAGNATGFEGSALLSVRWLSVVGVVALLFAAGFAVRLAIQEGLIGPFARVLLGTVIGTALALGGGYAATRTRHERWGWTVSGGGVAIAYLSVYAAYGFDAYREALGTPFGVVLAGLTVITAATAITAVREDRYILCGEAFLLGFVTAFFVRTIGPEALVYGALLTGGLVAVLWYREWTSLAVGGVLGAYALYVAATPTTIESTGLLLGSALYLGWTFFAYLGIAAHDRGSQEIAEALAVENVVFSLFPAMALTHHAFGRHMDSEVEAIPLFALAVIFAGLTFAAERDDLSMWDLRRLRVSPALAALTLFGAILYVSAFWSTIIAALALAVVAHCAAATGRTEYRRTAHVVFGVTLLKLVYDAVEFGAINREAIANPAVTYGLVCAAAAAYLTYWLFDTYDVYDHSRVGLAYVWGGSVLVASIPIVELSEYLLTGAWAMFGLLLLGIGLQYARRPLRQQALGLFGLATLKVFLVDTQGLDPVPRILSFAILGVLLIIAAFVYSKYSDDVLESVE